MFTRIVENRSVLSYTSLFVLSILITACGGSSDEHPALDQTTLAKQVDLNFDRIDSSETRAAHTEEEQRSAFEKRQQDLEAIERANSQQESTRAQSIPSNQLDDANVDLGAYAGQVGLLGVAGLAMGLFGDGDKTDEEKEQVSTADPSETAATPSESVNSNDASTQNADSTKSSTESQTASQDKETDEVFPDVEVYFLSEEDFDQILKDGWTIELSSLDNEAIQRALDPNCVDKSGSQSGSDTDQLQLILDSAGAQ